ncbi:MAG: oxidoreductase [Rhodospirillaceae bacterium]|nr:oxidoreductase [Rhodospirillaceae bacterium]|tara:strand:- start:970 stop:3237 length:2268 start_codon:yes stop_codon:yes gene_type:complete
MATALKDFKWVGTRAVRPDGVEKVTGRAKFGADFSLPGMLIGKVLRSPHAHAKIKSINIEAARTLNGVKAIITGSDFNELPSEWVPAGEVQINFRDLSRSIMARNKVLFEGHPVAAVAATSEIIAREALALIKVEYEILPHVIDVEAAMSPDAPILHEDLFTAGVEPSPKTASNIAKRVDYSSGNIDDGFKEADVIIEKHFTTQPVHQGYIEPHATVASASEDGQCSIWTSTQGQYVVRAYCSEVLQLDISSIRVTPSEIGGGFGGKTTVYLEPLALALSKKAFRPVKMVMSREEVFRSSGPTSGSSMKIKIGARSDGTITAADVELKYQAGAFPGSPIMPGCMCALAPYNISNAKVVGYDVVVNRPKVVAYRAPGAPISEYAVECVINEIATKLNIDPLDIREKNAAKEGTRALYGPQFGAIGYIETLLAARGSNHYKSKLHENQGRGVASGFWFNIGGESCATININTDGTAELVLGNPDIGGSRASLAMIAAEALGIDYNKVHPIISDTSGLGYNFLTGGSRTTFAGGLAVNEAAEDVVRQIRERASKIWDIPEEAVTWEDGFVRPAGTNAGNFEPLSLADVAGMAAKTGGPISGHAQLNAQGAGPGFGTHICDVEVDEETGRVTILRYTVVQDVGKAIHPSYVEGQMQGGASQGIGWALNEEYIYDEEGKLQNAGFLDYRIPVASDLPMIDTIIVEVPNPRHPYGVKGVGEVPIVPPMAAVAGAIADAIGVHLTDLPMSPPRILKELNKKQ